MLELRQVTKKVGAATHIEDVSLVLESGSLNVLLGPTLSGKTTLMRLMAGLDTPTGGDVFMNGAKVTGVPVQKRNIAMVYQQFINYPTLTVYENIASPLRVAGVDGAEIDRRVRQAAELMRLTPMLDRTPLALSGGQQQRTALARAVVKRAELPRLFAETGAIFVYATTEPTEALLLGGNTATLSKGRITQFGPTTEVYRRPADLITATTFSDPPMNTLRATKAGGAITLADGATLPATGRLGRLGDGAYLFGFRPHDLHLEPGETDTIAVPATVAVTEITGSESFVHLDAPDGRWVGLMHGIRPIEIGARVEVRLDPERFFVFSADSGRAVATPPAMAA